MRLVLQRVTRASVRVSNEVVSTIGPGLLILVGIGEGDDSGLAKGMALKTAELRIFDNDEGHFDRSLLDCGGEALVVSQFTLYADTRRGRRPSFTTAADPGVAAPLVEAYAAALEALGVRVGRGTFGAHMAVELENDGPVTVIVDSADLDRPRRASGGTPG